MQQNSQVYYLSFKYSSACFGHLHSSSFKWQVINLRICRIWLVDSVESMMLHGLAKPKFVSCACILVLLLAVYSASFEVVVMSRAYYLVDIFESRTSVTICVDSASGNCEAPLGSNPLTSANEKDTPKTRRANCVIIGALVTVRNYTSHWAPLLSSAESCWFRSHCCN